MPLTQAAQMPANLHTVALTVSLMQKRGLQVDALLSGSGIAVDDLRQPAMMISHAQELIVFHNAYEQSGDASIGLEIGTAMHISSYGMLGYSMLVSPTLGDSIQCALDFPLLLGSYFDISLETDDQFAYLCAKGYNYRPDLYLMNSEMCLSSLWAIIRDVMSAPVVPVAVKVANAAPKHQSQYISAFGVEGTFDTSTNALVFPKEWLAQALPLAEPVSYLMARRQCAQLASEWQTASGHGVVAKALRLLHAEPKRYNTLTKLADGLCMSERTLRRRFAAANTSFQTLIDKVRFELAQDYLSHTRLSIAEVAEKLGYSETASFRHAFHRWSGKVPSEWRDSR
ncbi:AraC family transcriptional regulator [Leeia sp. TBRC 13508]|uniref:AraC family transcriptional regulator n=1 Tax=Leeia speluncae TaxID=2884804 RepID=A0ABS8D4W4_9NEIS|nr:AraC family transcriptional regulator [Leeia speluncae]MCB6183256.1 AraC family transcriptional regulator [Leeia speluncae]